DLHLEQLLDRLLDLVLGRIAADLEPDLVGRITKNSALLGHMRTEQDLEYTLLVHASHSSTARTASTVISTFSCRSRLTGSMPLTSRTSTFGRLRAARNRFSVTSSATISTSVSPSSASLATNSLVLGVSTVSDGTTTRRSWRASSDRIDRIAPWYI